jgi:hypothetical protein
VRTLLLGALSPRKEATYEVGDYCKNKEGPDHDERSDRITCLRVSEDHVRLLLEWMASVYVTALGKASPRRHPEREVLSAGARLLDEDEQGADPHEREGDDRYHRRGLAPDPGSRVGRRECQRKEGEETAVEENSFSVMP